MTARLAKPTPPLALSMGEPAGIGPEITVIAWAERRRLKLPAFVVFGDPELLASRAHSAGIDAAVVSVASAREGAAAFDERLPVIPIRLAARCTPGSPDPGNARAVIAAIEAATAAVADGSASALVTNPIAKSVLTAVGFAHPGHTEFLGELAARHWPGHPARPVMMLAADELRVVPLTVHMPLSRVPGAITKELIDTTANVVETALRTDFGIAHPRIAVAGLNPHAGENATLGPEERDVIAPAIRKLAAAGLRITGPHSADTLFHAAARATYDAVIAMYHDQALIPLKTLAFDRGVNVTLGLPFVRTSPDHGTAFDIAGSAAASPASFVAALRLACALAASRTARMPT